MARSPRVLRKTLSGLDFGREGFHRAAAGVSRSKAAAGRVLSRVPGRSPPGRATMPPPAPRGPAPAAPREDAMSDDYLPTSGTVEELLRTIAGMPRGTSSFGIWVPEELTHKGRPTLHEAAMVLLRDVLLA